MDIKQDAGLLSHVRIKQGNQKRIMDLIQENDGLSRADIAKILNLSKPAVSSNIAELLTTNIIFEDGTNESNGGRRAVMLKYNSSFGTYVSIIIKPAKLKIVYFDLKGKVLQENILKIDIKNKDPKHVVLIIEEHILSEVERLGLTNIVCIIVSFPGIIKSNKILVSNSLPLFNDCDICSYFKNVLNCKIMLINDMNVKVTGMHDIFSDAHYKNIVYLSHEVNGIGAGLFINGQVYEGSQKSAGEVGLAYNINKEFPTNELKGSLVSYEELLFNTANVKDIDNFDELLRYYKSDDKIIKSLAQYYSVMIHNFSVMIDPDVVILGGLLYKLGDNFLNRLKKYINQISIISINLIISDFDNDAEIKGLRAIAGQYINRKMIDFIYK